MSPDRPHGFRDSDVGVCATRCAEKHQGVKRLRRDSKHTTFGVDDVERIYIAHGERLRDEVRAFTTLRLMNDSVATSSAKRRCDEVVTTRQSASAARSGTDARASRKQCFVSRSSAGHDATRLTMQRYERNDRVIRRLLRLSSVSLNMRSLWDRSRILLTA